MNINEAIAQSIGEEKYRGFVEAGVSDISILENACLTAFLNPTDTEGEYVKVLRDTLASAWDKPPPFILPK